MWFIPSLVLLATLVMADKFEELTSSQREQWMSIPHSVISDTFSIHPQAGICVLESKMYFYGGFNLTDTTGDFFELDLSTMTSKPIVLPVGSPTPGIRKKHFLLADDDDKHLYLLGGKDTPDLTPWKFSTKDNTWTQLAHDLPHYINEDIEDNDYAVASLPGYLVVVGSKDGKSGDYLIYSKTANNWTRISPKTVLTYVEDPVLIPSDNTKVYLVGGSTATGYLPNKTGMLDISVGYNNLGWVPLPGIPGEDLQGFRLGDIIGVMGDPGGRGGMASNNGIAIVNTTEGGNWTTISQGSVWPPLSNDIRVTQYRDKIIMLGALVGKGFRSDKIWVYDPTVCPSRCNGHGLCKLGNCECATDYSGIACEVKTVVNSYMAIVIGAVVGGGTLIIIAAAVIWKQTSKMRQYRKLYSTSRIAEDMAAQIARMELEHLDYLMHIQHPTNIQQSFQTIIGSLLLYRSYLPESLLHRNTENDSETTQESKSQPSRNSSRSPSDPSKEILSPICLMQELNKTTVRDVAVLRTTISSIQEGNQVVKQLKLHRNSEHSYKDLVDTIQISVQSTRGSILLLAGDVILSAWNFSMNRAMAATHAIATAFKIGTDTDTFKINHAITKKLGQCGTMGGTKLRSPVLIGPHMDITTALSRVSICRNLPVLTDLRELGSNHGLLPVDVISLGAYASCSGTVFTEDYLVEVYSVVNLSNQGSEWMYELDALVAQNDIIFSTMTTYKKSGGAFTLAMILESSTDTQIQMQLLKESIESAGVIRVFV